MDGLNGSNHQEWFNKVVQQVTSPNGDEDDSPKPQVKVTVHVTVCFEDEHETTLS